VRGAAKAGGASSASPGSPARRPAGDGACIQLWRQAAQRTCRPEGPIALSGTT
jgi:hypothetical protein